MTVIISVHDGRVFWYPVVLAALIILDDNQALYLVHATFHPRALRLQRDKISVETS